MREFERGQLRQWAVKGAEQRLLEIAKEAAAIHRAFPELRESKSAAVTAEASRARPRGATRRGRHMRSAAARQAARERMQKYWAERRTQAGQSKAEKPARAAAAGRRGPRKMSAAARKRISEAQKKRWAERKASRGKQRG